MRGLGREAKGRYPMLWYTGQRDDGSTSEDHYDAIADARAGSSWYKARGFRVRLQQPRWLDHEDLGTRFGRLLDAQVRAANAARSTKSSRP